MSVFKNWELEKTRKYQKIYDNSQVTWDEPPKSLQILSLRRVTTHSFCFVEDNCDMFNSYHVYHTVSCGRYISSTLLYDILLMF